MGDRRMLEILMCIQCTGGRKTEMLCTGDNRMHALEEFSKSQRNDPDNAVSINNINSSKDETC